jgi:hypothetical protein
MVNLKITYFGEMEEKWGLYPYLSPNFKGNECMYGSYSNSENQREKNP